MKPSFASSVACIGFVGSLLYGCGSSTLGAGTGSAGTTGDAGGMTGAAGSGGTTGAGGASGTTGAGAAGGTGSRPFICIYPESARCPTLCGNGVRESCYFSLGLGVDCDNSFIEWCDGEDLGTATCASRGLGTGTLRCTSDCGFDTSGCSGAQGGSGGASASTARP